MAAMIAFCAVIGALIIFSAGAAVGYSYALKAPAVQRRLLARQRREQRRRRYALAPPSTDPVTKSYVDGRLPEEQHGEEW